MSERPPADAPTPTLDQDPVAQHNEQLRNSAINQKYGLRLDEPTDMKKQLAEHKGINGKHIGHNDMAALKQHARKGRAFTGASWESSDGTIYKAVRLDTGTAENPHPPQYVLKTQSRGSSKITEQRWSPDNVWDFVNSGKTPAERAADERAAKAAKKEELERAHQRGRALLAATQSFINQEPLAPHSAEDDDDRSLFRVTAEQIDDLIKRRQAGVPADDDSLRKLADAIQIEMVASDKQTPGKEQKQYFFINTDGTRTDLNTETAESILSLKQPESDPKAVARKSVADAFDNTTTGEDTRDDAISAEEAARRAQQLEINEAIARKQDLTGNHYTTENGAEVEILKQENTAAGEPVYRIKTTSRDADNLRSNIKFRSMTSADLATFLKAN